MSSDLFDKNTATMSLQRYTRARDFLRDILLEEIKEKINDHQRPFTRIGIIAFDAPSWSSELPFEAQPIEWQSALRLEPAQYDLLLHLHCLHRENDPVGQMVQARHALKPDGVFIAAFLGGESLQELRQAFFEADAQIYEGAAPHIAPMIEIKDAGNLLARAGFALPIADNIKRQALYPTPRALLHDLRDLGLTNPLTARRKNFTRKALFNTLDQIYSANNTCEPGQIYASFEQIFLTGYAPSQNQPKPLRPGSITQAFGASLEN